MTMNVKECSLLDIPIEVWSTIISFASSPDCDIIVGKSRNESSISSVRCTCWALSKWLSSEEYYRARLSDGIRALEGLLGRDEGRPAGFGNEWPSAECVGGYKNLYSIMARFAPLEGWYSLCDAWPWGMLLLMSFRGGSLCGDAVRAWPKDSHQPADAGHHAGNPVGNHVGNPVGNPVGNHVGGGYCCRVERVLEISFDSKGEPRCHVAGQQARQFGIRWKSHSGRSHVKKVDVARALDVFHCFSDDDVFPHNNGLLFQVSDILRGEDSPSDAADPFLHEFTTDPFFLTTMDNPRSAPPPAAQLIRTLLRRDVPNKRYWTPSTAANAASNPSNEQLYPGGLLLEYLGGPMGRPWNEHDLHAVHKTRPIRLPRSLKQSLSVPYSTLPPGFYVGGYGQMYSHFQHEILQIQYHQTTKSSLCASNATSPNNPDPIRDALGNRLTKDVLRILINLSLNHSDQITLASARKITGDIHVPSGEVTWLAITSLPPIHIPSSSQGMTYTIPGTDVTIPFPPKLIHERKKGTQNQYQVLHAWPGWGTLAGPFFSKEFWQLGYLLQLLPQHDDTTTTTTTNNNNNNESCSCHRDEIQYAFFWSGSHWQDAIVLHKVPFHFGSYLWTSSQIEYT